MLDKIQTDLYSLHVLAPDEAVYLQEFGNAVACSDGVIPNVYGVYNKDTKVYEHYCANLPQAMSIISALQEGFDQEYEKFKPKGKLRSI